ncbi:MBL fold metallo-hydrolase RNA specificity domain-containing protein [Paraburkholderia megapolitana]|uniref:Metallo-beta-lactamase family protein n=1 Tax=Paraburkholderia megapolitana TaxID=420953 RepID=A0A1I3Q2B8_9BURK|nr:MBL fold metallo-hydrolase RNA specificity domain-containing protein [Paraburkholderia megapolitana]QDQ81090.1 MBL fold metallo-hydrolase [Paraburkholderia megapolitana]SFJ27790.1 metallo-beta-lactamase family protein [Paraburkholderia megapolitana]
MKLTFLGATETVTGSRYLLEGAGLRILIDSGFFEGAENRRARSCKPFPTAVDSLDAVILTHAHIDHSGYLPALVREGYRGPVYCTPGTADLCGIMLDDNATFSKEETGFACRHGDSKQRPALPLYAPDDAQRALQLLRPHEFDTPIALNDAMCFRFLPAGHILSAASVVLCWRQTILAFSGDLRRPQASLIRAPSAPIHADYLVVESIPSLSVHADYSDTLSWLGSMTDAPARTFITHGEPSAVNALRRQITETLGWCCEVPAPQQSVELEERPIAGRAALQVHLDAV